MQIYTTEDELRDEHNDRRNMQKYPDSNVGLWFLIAAIISTVMFVLAIVGAIAYYV